MKLARAAEEEPLLGNPRHLAAQIINPSARGTAASYRALEAGKEAAN